MSAAAANASGYPSNDALVSALIQNTTGAAPTTAAKNVYLNMLNAGTTLGDLVVSFADSTSNSQSIKLTTLATTGLPYTPFVIPAPPTYKLTANATSVNEGMNASFNLTTTNVASGTSVGYLISGVSVSDLTSNSLSGAVTIGNNGQATITIPIAADQLVEGSETLTITSNGVSASTVVIDTSKSTAAPTYSLTAATTSVNEGQLAQVYVATTNVAAGTALDFSITGISRSDVIENLSRQVIVDAAGRAVIDINVVADLTTEGPETLFITMDTSVASIFINDTSVALVGVIDNGGGDGGGGGGGGGAGGD